jgi:hypothetical protein
MPKIPHRKYMSLVCEPERMINGWTIKEKRGKFDKLPKYLLDPVAPKSCHSLEQACPS